VSKAPLNSNQPMVFVLKFEIAIQPADTMCIT